MQSNLSTSGINFSFVDASRFEPSYDFPVMSEINRDHFYAQLAESGAEGDR